ncbi:hypothetical protein LTR62_008475 [Meristemomyces frigidus]|uniref:Uncharacterized protein n=1 Tax=Meristemomyces frigidus TaxID=1508187 RepID=A0AAN7YM63_9PEZI|nr:hypothetical protein LTR62_008475 [Meristemomyces frigidus]
MQLSLALALTLTLFSLFSLSTLAGSICNSGEIALSVNQLCTTEHASSCSWNNDASVVSDGNNVPDAIYIDGDVCGNCYQPGNGHSAFSSAFSYENYTSVDWCCGKEN